MTDPPRRPDPRFRPPSARTAKKNLAGIGALLNAGGSGFGVQVVDPNAPGAIEQARAAYSAEPEDPRAYPMPAPLNWLSSLRPADLKKLPAGARNFLVNMVKSAVRDPVSALMPVPKAGIVAKEMARPARIRGAAREAANYHELQVADMVDRMKKMDPVRSKYPHAFQAAEKSVHNASRKVMEWETPYQFTRQGPRRMLAKGAAGDDVASKLTSNTFYTVNGQKALITPSTREPGLFQGTMFDASGTSPNAHVTGSSAADVAKKLEKEGFSLRTEPTTKHLTPAQLAEHEALQDRLSDMEYSRRHGMGTEMDESWGAADELEYKTLEKKLIGMLRPASRSK